MALFRFAVDVFFVGLVLFRIDVECFLAVFSKEFTAETSAKELPNILFVHALKLSVFVSLAIFTSMPCSLTPKTPENMETMLLVFSEVELLRPVHAFHKTDKAIEGEDEFFHVLHQTAFGRLLFIL